MFSIWLGRYNSKVDDDMEHDYANTYALAEDL